ncbi:phage tail protein [Escherichia coli]
MAGMMPFERLRIIIRNLGLGEGSALPVGVPVPWPSATPPTGWLKCNGAPFSAEEYPKLAKAYPKLKLPDLRGEFIRGWDDGRGVDSARLLLSSQGHLSLNITMNMHQRQRPTHG